MVDYRAGSERMLRVHHKNMVQNRTLQNNIRSLDSVCRKNVNKVQQNIFDVYYREFLPLREEQSIRFPGRAVPMIRIHGSRTNQENRTKNNIEEKCVLPTIISDKRRLEDNQLKQLSTVSCLSKPLSLPSLPRLDTPSVFLRKVSNGSVSTSLTLSRLAQHEEERKLKAIRKAVALTSQPAPKVDNSRRGMLRKSFLLSLRRQSKAVWETETLKRVAESIDYRKRKSSALSNIGSSPKDSMTKSGAIACKPSTAKKAIFNHDKTEECAVQNFSRLKEQDCTFDNNEDEGDFPRSESDAFSIHGYEEDDWNYLSSSPDIFSEINEEPSDFSDSTFEELSSNSEYSDMTPDGGIHKLY
ncbi:hypothetical protein FSP39_004498 [Pinctada imbricata]|uniref:Uncharacterized protein n=1 Tax=Pinctada imbricata TaxID=66713 RepID=A0AA89C0H4_PINIB|nr:hypothetical protein FSP39_004498 [Pinctada imbricata]